MIRVGCGEGCGLLASTSLGGVGLAHSVCLLWRGVRSIIVQAIGVMDLQHRVQGLGCSASDQGQLGWSAWVNGLSTAVVV